MCNGIDLSTLQLESGDICIVTIDIKKYNLEDANAIFKQIEKALYPIKVIGIPNGVKIEKIDAKNLIQYLEDQLL